MFRDPRRGREHELELELKFKLAEDTSGKPFGFYRDAEWLVDNLINPEWVVSIRLDGTPGAQRKPNTPT